MLAVHLTDFGDVRVLQIWFTDSDPCRLPILDSGEDLSQDHNREMSDFQLECVHTAYRPVQMWLDTLVFLVLMVYFP